MQILETIESVRRWRKGESGARVAFVPTMGNLHEGHLSLVKAAKMVGERVIVSIFVNPLQFGEGEDLESYPRTLEADLEKLRALGVSAVFLPKVEEFYPEEDLVVTIHPPKKLIAELCGASRPGHFEGVATVVTKFFNIVQPDFACFGKKDYQQLRVIESLVAGLNLDIEIIPVEIERAEDGLALSSRNGYLTERERAKAPELYAALKSLKEGVEAGGDFRMLEALATNTLNQNGWKVDYLTLRRQKDLAVAEEGDRALILLAAATLGTTRLLDNLEIEL